MPISAPTLHGYFTKNWHLENFKKGILCTEEGGVVERRTNLPPINKDGGISERSKAVSVYLFASVAYGLQSSWHENTQK